MTPGVHADAVEAGNRRHEVARPGDDVPREPDTSYVYEGKLREDSETGLHYIVRTLCRRRCRW